jgi:hypothetical protein
MKFDSGVTTNGSRPDNFNGGRFIFFKSEKLKLKSEELKTKSEELSVIN